VSTVCTARADDYYPSVHTCDDPAACALDNLGPIEQTEADRLHDLLDRVEELCEASTAKVAQSVLTAIHTERGGPR
jgi:hypothetical protein